MSLIKVDLGSVVTLAPIPAGNYTVAITEATIGQGANGAYIAWTYEIVDGTYEGRKVFENTSVAPKALFKLKSLLAAIGVDVSGEVSLNPASYVGTEISIRVGVRAATEDYEASNVVRKHAAL